MINNLSQYFLNEPISRTCQNVWWNAAGGGRTEADSVACSRETGLASLAFPTQPHHHYTHKELMVHTMHPYTGTLSSSSSCRGPCLGWWCSAAIGSAQHHTLHTAFRISPFANTIRKRRAAAPLLVLRQPPTHARTHTNTGPGPTPCLLLWRNMGASASKFGQYEANRGGLSPSVVELGAEASGK